MVPTKTSMSMSNQPSKKPISVNEIPTSLSHALNVEKTSMYGSPEAKPSSKIPNIFLFITLILIVPN